MVLPVICLLVGFVVGALVFRNNAEKAGKVVSTAEKAEQTAKTVINDLRK